jgi:hypothetical protein
LFFIFPVIVFFGLVLKDSWYKYWVYAIFPFFPLAPAAAILLQLSERKIYGISVAVAHVEFINRPVAYVMLIL